ncbi:chorion transcription factor Cf2 isoform X2 [Drosophila mauritiana]|uniref:Chorion transcription factor Cf2 isoform X2 n=1 Tax=Drosophila mauritiana TaxID=7226 RepID=A0A6P8LH32_DROMA|nr:chorion transcription factor Cf2 isoform X2 [Drosophila mauritiana]
MIKSTTNPQEQRLPRPEDQSPAPPPPPSSATTSTAAPATPTHQVATVIANMDTLKTAFLPNLSMDPNVHVSPHYCPMCHQQFERPQHVADHMQLCHGITLNAQGAIATLDGGHPQAQQHPKLSHPCFNCDEKFGNAVDLDEHHRLAHQTSAFLARCLICSIYGIHSATQQPNEYKCTQCGSICTTAMLAAGQQGFMEQQEAAVTPDDQLPAMAPRDMRLTPEEQHHQQQLQAEHHHQQQHQQQQQQQQQELLEQQQREMQEQAQQQQVHHHQQDQDLAGDQVSLKVPPLTVKLNKNANGGAIVAHPQVIIKEEPLSLSDSGDVVNSVPVYAIQANPCVPAPASSGVLVGTQTVPADLAHKIRHKCPDCPKTFKTPGTLAMHRKIHTGEADATPKERPYTCSYCGKSFTQSNTLKQHTRIHTGEKPFRCGYCGRAFTVKDYLNKHLTTHTGEKPFHCNYCEKSFSVKDYLTKHIRTHTGEKPYTCPYCDKRFTQRSALTVHTTKLHPL